MKKKFNYRNLYLGFHLLILLLVASSGGRLSAQERSVTVSGNVTDLQGKAIPGVTVVQEGTTNGAITNNDGIYSIKVTGKPTLIFSFVGMTSQRIPVNQRTRINVVLQDETIGLEEVVAIGYSSQSKKKVTSSISRIDQEALQNISSVSPVQALQGKMAGVSVPVLTGQPGAAANIVIRGGTTLRPYGTIQSGSDVGNRDSSDPLVIVDGVFRNFTDVNPDDIESIQVMKDAASTAIYGARGANGVILIKTKSGKGTRKANFTFHYQHGIETQARKYDYMNAKEYLTLARQTMMKGIDNFDVKSYLYISGNSATVPTFLTKGAYGVYKFTPAYIDNLVTVEGQPYVDNLLAKGWETMDDPATPGKTIIFKDSHYQDVVWNTAHTNNYNFGASGSNESTNYNFSLGYVDQGGIFLGTGYKRFSSLANARHQLNEKVSLNMNFSYLWNDNKYSDNIERDLVRGVRVPPLNRLYNDDGTPNINEGNNPRNRLHQLYYQDNNINNVQLTMRLEADWEIVKNLHYRPSASLNSVNYSRLYFEKFYPEQPNPRDKYQAQSQSNQIMTDHVLQYNHTFASNHNLMMLGGFNFTRNKSFSVVATSQRSATDYISTISGDPASTTINGVVSPNFGASSSYGETKSASFFGQASYDFANKYLFAASLRRDGFSNFAPENRFATFPSLSAGWNVSNEKFWKVKVINNLKLRTSWGKTGLSGLSINDTYGVYGSSLYATASGLTRSNIPNAKLLWETTEATDAGFDIGLFNSRINLTFDVYNKLTKNRLADLPLAAETGFSSIKYNVGSLRNRGLEVELDARILDSNGFKWNSTFTFAFNRTVVVELPENGRDKNRINGGKIYDPNLGKDIEAGGYAEGERPLGLWAWKSNGIFSTDAEAAASPIKDMLVPAANLGKVKHGGDVNWADLNGDNLINEKDMVFMGYRVPDKIGGFQNTFTYKGFSLRVNMDYAMGHVISDGALGREMGQGRGSNEGAPRMALSDETWQKQGDVGKKYPRFSFADYDIGYRNHLRFSSLSGYSGMGFDNSYGVDNSIYYSKGDFLAFREVSLSYTIPAKICKILYMKNIIFSGGVYNIGYLTAYKGLNPEVYKGYDEGGYPRPRQFTFGANLTF
ncbi:MAG: SusC/RagA family TonB-linked outer membrane protein [Prolixibacteraceae bacterium]